MDAVFFAVKQAHLAGSRFCRRLLSKIGLTPARFDLLVAVRDDHNPTQTQLRRRLGIARSTLSELVASVERAGWIERKRASDGRTWDLILTKCGKALIARAYQLWINRGVVPLAIDASLAMHEPEVDCEQERFALVSKCMALHAAFGRAPVRDLYMWDPDDYLDEFAWPDLPSSGIPFVQGSASSEE